MITSYLPTKKRRKKHSIVISYVGVCTTPDQKEQILSKYLWIPSNSATSSRPWMLF